MRPTDYAGGYAKRLVLKGTVDATVQSTVQSNQPRATSEVKQNKNKPAQACIIHGDAALVAAGHLIPESSSAQMFPSNPDLYRGIKVLGSSQSIDFFKDLASSDVLGASDQLEKEPTFIVPDSMPKMPSLHDNALPEDGILADKSPVMACSGVQAAPQAVDEEGIMSTTKSKHSGNSTSIQRISSQQISIIAAASGNNDIGPTLGLGSVTSSAQCKPKLTRGVTSNPLFDSLAVPLATLAPAEVRLMLCDVTTGCCMTRAIVEIMA